MNDYESLMKFLKKLYFGDVETSEPTEEEKREVPSTKARDLLNYLIEKSYDCGDVVMIPKRIIEGVKDNIID